MNDQSAATATLRDDLLLSEQQVRYFETFGYLRIPGLFADDIDRIIGGFEQVFANEEHPRLETYEELHLEKRRLIIPGFISKSDDLRWLLDDPRTVGVCRSLIGDDYEYAESDGNLFDCESEWHSDIYAAPFHQYHLKLSFYLDSLTGGSGAIRVMPGTNHHTSEYAKRLRRDLNDPTATEALFGVEGRDLPSWTVHSEPGDLVVWNFRTIHASYNGGERRRLFSVNFREPDSSQGQPSDTD